MHSDASTLIPIVRQLLASGRAAHLAELMAGDSPFNSRSPQNYPPLPVNREEQIDLVYTARMAWEHVSFIARFGNQASSVTSDQRHYCSYPEYFERWLGHGCTGLLLADVQGYL